MSLMCSLWNQAWILYVLLLWFLYWLLSSRGQGRWKCHSPHSPGASITVVAESNSQRKETMRKPSQWNLSLESDSLLYQLCCDAVEHRGRVCPWRHRDVWRLWQRSKRPAGHWHQPLALGFPSRTLLSPAISAIVSPYWTTYCDWLLYSTEYSYHCWRSWGQC